jgi:hypothetical protein
MIAWQRDEEGFVTVVLVYCGVFYALPAGKDHQLYRSYSACCMLLGNWTNTESSIPAAAIAAAADCVCV